MTNLNSYDILKVPKGHKAKGDFVMKKIVSLIMVCVLMTFVLVSCGSNISESYAKKINDAAKGDKAYTYEEVMADLGDEAIDVTVEVMLLGRTGVIIAVKDVKSREDVEKLIDEGKDVKGIIITIAADKAISAKYGEINKDSFKIS